MATLYRHGQTLPTSATLELQLEFLILETVGGRSGLAQTPLPKHDAPLSACDIVDRSYPNS